MMGTHTGDVWVLPRVSQEGRVLFCMVQTPDLPAVGEPRQSPLSLHKWEIANEFYLAH